MHKLDHFFLVLAVCTIMACASRATTQQETLHHIRESTRFLNKGVQLYNKGCFPRAVFYLQKAHEHFTAADDLQGLAYSLNSMANAYYHLQDIDGAAMIYDEALEAYTLLGDSEGLARAQINKAATLIESGQWDQATRLLDNAQSIARGKEALTANLYKTRAILHLNQGAYDAAESLLKKALASISEDQTNSFGFSSIHYSLGQVMLQTNRPAKGLNHLNNALVTDRKLGAYFNIARDLEAIGDCFLALDQPQQALSSFKRSAKIFALLAMGKRVQDVVAKMEQTATNAKIDIRAALHWINQWIAGDTQDNLCR